MLLTVALVALFRLLRARAGHRAGYRRETKRGDRQQHEGDPANMAVSAATDAKPIHAPGPAPAPQPSRQDHDANARAPATAPGLGR